MHRPSISRLLLSSVALAAAAIMPALPISAATPDPRTPPAMPKKRLGRRPHVNRRVWTGASGQAYRYSLKRATPAGTASTLRKRAKLNRLLAAEGLPWPGKKAARERTR